jgi:hypothetical protein
MAFVTRSDATRASHSSFVQKAPDPEVGDFLDLTDLEAEMNKLSAINQELMGSLGDSVAATCLYTASLSENADPAEVETLRHENANLKARVQELEAMLADNSEANWQERQREYEMLLEEKSEVIRGLHQKIQESQEAVDLGGGGPSLENVPASSIRLGQAEEILRLKRELEEQRKQIEQDEEDMMAQMRQMELAMAKERAEMARQRQEMVRLQADLAREVEQSSRDPELRERLQNLRRTDGRPGTMANPPKPQAQPQQEQKSSGFFRRIFG